VYAGDTFGEEGESSPLIEGNIIADNCAAELGGGIFLKKGSAVVRRNIIRNNFADGDGGGLVIYQFSGHVVVEENQFWENRANDHGGGMAVGNLRNASSSITGNLFVRNVARGLGNGDTGSGGAAWIVNGPAEFSNNTVVVNQGTGESVCSSGGIVLDSTDSGLIMTGNIIALNMNCGIACFLGTASFGENLLWANTRGNINDSKLACPSEWDDIALIADPQFCDPDNDNFTVSKDSPALTGEMTFGAFTNPGCGEGVAVEPVSWGGIKLRYQ
jgi:hypothetical protein